MPGYPYVGYPRQTLPGYCTRAPTAAHRDRLPRLASRRSYQVGSFYFAAKSFDVLERLDPNPEYWEGKRGACVGVFQVRERESMPGPATCTVPGDRTTCTR